MKAKTRSFWRSALGRGLLASFAAAVAISPLAACAQKKNDADTEQEQAIAQSTIDTSGTFAPHPDRRDPHAAADTRSLIVPIQTPVGFQDTWVNIPAPSRADIPLDNSRVGAAHVAQKCVELYYWSRYNRNGSQIAKWTRPGSPYEWYVRKEYLASLRHGYVLEDSRVDYKGNKVISSLDDNYTVLVNVKELPGRLYIQATGEVIKLPALTMNWRVQVSYRRLGWECRNLEPEY